MKIEDVRAHFEAGFRVTPGCWEWLRGKDRGYGILKSGGVKYKAYRFSYELYVGPIPPGLHLRHLCNNPSCVNPDNLKPGTHAENMKDIAVSGKKKGQRPSTTVLTEEKVREIKKLLKESQRTVGCIAKQFGVCPSTISHIRTGRLWSDII